MEKVLKNKLLSYAVISAISFTYLILADNSGISVPIFIILQFLCLLWIAPMKKALYMFIPIFILSVNSFISGNTMWRSSNFIVITLLYSSMALLMVGRFPIKELSLDFIYNTLSNVIYPIKYITLPISWCGEINKEKSLYIKRILIGIVITFPSIIFLLIMLSSADAVFSYNMKNVFEYTFKFLEYDFIFKVIFGVLVGLYLFGMLYMTYAPIESSNLVEARGKNGDLLIINILLVSVLVIYTMFVIIQFQYLFTGGQLPYGLNYSEYARKGFFELLFLSGLNILLILITVDLTKDKLGFWAKATKSLCCYLCSVTIVLLVSSFYRMWLYNADNGLTRLRLLVFGFLIFESIGLIVTFFYIIKPKFNITAVYTVIALAYYLVLNLTPIDNIIAKNQVDRYFRNEKCGIDYAITLSTDAAPQISRLLSSEVTDNAVKEKAKEYFKNIDRYYSSFDQQWQSYNVSVDRAMKIAK